jgi:hypothetical protein
MSVPRLAMFVVLVTLPGSPLAELFRFFHGPGADQHRPTLGPHLLDFFHDRGKLHILSVRGGLRHTESVPATLKLSPVFLTPLPKRR